MIDEQLKMTVREYADRIEKDLRENLLPFWMREAKRPGGSFHGEVGDGLRVDAEAERGCLLTARILWTYSTAWLEYGHAAYLEMADYAYADLCKYFADREHGGFIWSIHADGTPRRDRKQVYGQAFAIYALTAYHQACGRQQVLDEAIAVFRLLESHARDPKDGGYFDAYANDWSPIDDFRLSERDLNAPKSQNTLLHIMEAYTLLLTVWPDPQLKAAHKELVELMLDKVLDPDHPHLGLFFDADWRCWDPEALSYGHDIEAAWLLKEAAVAQGDPGLSSRVDKRVVEIADAVLAAGVDTDGALFYEGNLKTGVTNAKKDWWPQSEAIMGFITAYQVSGGKRFLETALRMWDFVEARMIDGDRGGWHMSIAPSGKVDPAAPRISFWNCPYHNGRCGMEAPKRLRGIGGVSPGCARG